MKHIISKILAWKVKKLKILHKEVRETFPQNISQRSQKFFSESKNQSFKQQSHKSKKSNTPSTPPKDEGYSIS